MSGPKTIVLLETSEVTLEPGASLKVEVPAMGASGNIWSISSDQVRVLDHTKAPSETSFGAGGKEVFTLQPLREGRSIVKFRLGAPWRQQPTEEHTLMIDVPKRPSSR